MTTSQIEDGPLESVQRSWVLERLDAIRRFEGEIGSDYEHVAGLAESVLQGFRKATTVLEYLQCTVLGYLG